MDHATRPMKRRSATQVAAALIALLLLGSVAAVSAQAAGQPAAGNAFTVQQLASIAREADEAAAEFLEATGGSALSVALGGAGGPLWAGQYGLADKEAKAAPGPGTMFGIGSTSKMFATAAAMILVDRGLAELDKPVAAYLPEFRMASPGYEKITLRMLLNHSAGFPGTDYRNGVTRAPVEGYPGQVLATLAESRLKHEPGWMSVYANDGFTVVELLVKALTGKDFAHFVDQEILKPLGMGHSRYPLEYFPKGSFATPYKEDKAQAQEFLGPLGSGGLYSTPSDLTRFAAMIIGKGSLEGRKVLSPKAVDAMGEDQTRGKFNPLQGNSFRFGLGWDSVTQPAMASLGIKGWEKGGDTNSYGAVLIVLPEEGLSAAVTGASGLSSGEATAIAERILARALVERGRIAAMPSRPEPADLPRAELLPEAAKRLSGVYVAFNAVFKFEIDSEGMLSMQVCRAGTWTPAFGGLSHRSDGWFSAPAESGPPISVSFLSAEGRDYVNFRMPSPNGWYKNPMVFAQKLAPAKPLSPAWQARIGKTWLPANFAPYDDYLSPSNDPRLRLIPIEGAEGYVFSLGADGTFTTLPPQGRDDQAQSFILVPAVNGRDLMDVDVIGRGEEEWLREGSIVYRPLDSVPSAAPGETALAIGPEGYAEWRRLPGESKFSVTGAAATKLYDENFAPLDDSTDKTGQGGAYIALFGAPGQAIRISTAPLGLSAEQKARIAQAGTEAALEVLKSSGGSALTAAIADEDGLIWAGQFGLADKERNQAPDADTLFGVGSVSKMFAAVSAMILVDRGLVDLDAPLSRYIKDFAMADPRYKEITVRMILDHSAGLPGADLRNAVTLVPYGGLAGQALRTLSSERLKHDPGFMAVYANDGFSLAELLVEAVSGQSFVAFVEKEIFKPLGMGHSRYPTEEFPQGSYAKAYAGGEEYPYLYLNMYGTGALYSTPTDMAKFSMMLALGGEYDGKRILSESSVREMGLDQTAGTFNPLPSDYIRFGLGWDTVVQPGMNALDLAGWQKGGDVTGFYGATMIVLPEENMAAMAAGSSGVDSGGSSQVAEALLLRTLVEKGRLAAMPSRVSASAAARRIPGVAERLSIEGYYAASGAIYRARFGSDLELGIDKMGPQGWVPFVSGLSARSDGWYSNDKSSSFSVRFIDTEKGRYFGIRKRSGYGHYLITLLFAQKLDSASPVPEAWARRAADFWLLANENPALAFPGDEADPRMTLQEMEELPGYLSYDWDGRFLVRPVAGDENLASMFLLIPGAQGRDLNDLAAFRLRGAEYLAVGGARFRAASTAPVAEIPAGLKGNVLVREIPIGPEGLGEWLRISVTEVPGAVLSIQGAKLWRLYSPDFSLAADGMTDGEAALEGESGDFWLVAYGEPGSKISLFLKEARK
ncbi:MAG: serine hydrolase domain-containing protein [Spirochaetota bacterium]